MDLVECFCGRKINHNNGPNHLLDCRKWQKKSPLFRCVKELLAQQSDPTLIKIECEALLMFEFPSEVILNQSPPHKHRKNNRKDDDVDEATKRLIEQLSNEGTRHNEDGVACDLCGCNKPDMSDMLFLNCNHILCKEHLKLEILSSYSTSGNVKCLKDCGYVLSTDEILAIISQAELDELQNSKILPDEDGVIASCSCGVTA